MENERLDDSKGNKPTKSKKTRRRSDVLEVRVSGMLKEHLAIASEVTGLTKAEMMRQGFTEYFRKLRKDYDLPKDMTYEEFEAGQEEWDE